MTSWPRSRMSCAPRSTRSWAGRTCWRAGSSPRPSASRRWRPSTATRSHRRGWGTPEPQPQPALAAIHRNAQSQSRLVDDVLDLSRIITGRMALTADPIDLSEIVRTTVESFTPAVLGKRQTVHLMLPAQTRITGDAHRLRQVIWNLLSNATKFTPEGGSITVRVAYHESRVELEVIDTGEGIDPAFLPYVFDRFRQGDSSSTRRHGGLGLGLSLVRHLVEAHGGTVAAASAGKGRGATITVRLPARVVEPALAAAASEGRSDNP